MQEMQDTPPLDGEKRGFKAVYTIVDRGTERKPFWLRIGTAFVNRDQSLHVKLDAHPTNGALHIRDYVPFDERRRFEEPARFDGGAR